MNEPKMEIPADPAALESTVSSSQQPEDSAESRKHKTLDEVAAETDLSKKPRFDDKDETLECLKNLCESVSERNIECPSESQAAEQSEVKPESSSKPLKKKRKKTKDPKDPKAKNKTNKTKAHLRKNIRDIFKDNELEAETRAAQQREIERVQRLQQLQQRPNVDKEEGEEDNPASTLVEDLQALAQELENNSLSPEIPLNFIHEEEQIKEESPFVTNIKVL